MPSANTKPVATRISKDLYWGLLKEAAEHQRTISKHLEAVLEEYLRKTKVPSKKAEMGAIIEQTIDVMTFDGYKGFVATKDGIGGRWQMRKVIRDIGDDDWELSAPLKDSNGMVENVLDRVDSGWMECPIFYKNGWKVIERGRGLTAPKGIRDIKTNLKKLEIK